MVKFLSYNNRVLHLLLMKYLIPVFVFLFSPSLVFSRALASTKEPPSISIDTSRIEGLYLIAQSSAREDYKESAALFKSGKYAESIAAFGRLISSPATSVKLKNQALIGRSQAFLVINQPNLAILDLQKITYQPQEKRLIANKNLILGVALIQVKQYQSAIKYLTQAIAYMPNDASAYVNRSVAYQALQDFDAAAIDIERALKINPTSSSVFNLAVLEKDRQNYSRCFLLLSQLVARREEYADIYLQRGLCSKALKQHQQALEDFLRASSIDSTKAEAIENAGLVLAIMGDPKTAIKYLELASSLYLQSGNIGAFESVSNHIIRITGN